jgi:hypothetical protein
VEPYIKQHEAGASVIDSSEGSGAVGSGATAITFVAEDAGNEFADVTFVINDEDIESHGNVLYGVA